MDFKNRLHGRIRQFKTSSENFAAEANGLARSRNRQQKFKRFEVFLCN